MNKYPFVFVHGFNGWGNGEGIDRILPYWGATTGDLMKFLSSMGYKGYSASVGPFSSAWDRCCELYAQLTGTTVDYGEVHSAKFNHYRYGRTYEKPIIEDWGKLDDEGKIKKIHLIGHSFGAVTIRLFVYLLMNGCEEEIAGTTEGKVSELFTGGKKDWVESVVTICGVHNSATTYYFAKDFHIYTPLQFLSAVYAGVLGRSALNGRMVDFHLEQFGISYVPGEEGTTSFIESIKKFMQNRDDSCEHDLTPDGMKTLNGVIKTNPDVYYFSYAFRTTHKGKKTKLTMPLLRTDPVIAPLACYIGHHKDFVDETTGQVYDESWHDSDSLCNTISETYPFTEDHVEYDKFADVPKGIWNVMPIQTGDHGQAIGLFENKNKTQRFYLDLAELLDKIEKQDNVK